MRPKILIGLAVALLLLAVGPPAAAQSSRVTTVDRYPEDAASTGLFREEETLPGAYRLYLQEPRVRGGFWGWGPGGGPVKKSSFAKDAHATVRDYYPQRSCTDCHEDSARNIHTARTTVTCRQCHRSQPVAGIHHYYSPLNPIRRHAYVCAKCHQGATANFSTYVVHEPLPWASETAKEFPAFYYAFWIMIILAGGVFIFFIPYVTLWGIRELIGKALGGKSHGGV